VKITNPAKIKDSMMKKMAALLLVSGIIILTTSFKKHAPVAKPVLRTIVIDPGHGGDFHGTRGLISKEEDVTLDIAVKLGEAIKAEFPDIKIVYTRTTASNVGGANTLKEDLHNRAQIANNARGDLFISIHCDATAKPAGGYYEKRVIGHKKKLEYVGRGKSKKKKMVTVPIYESYWVKNMVIGATTYIWKAEKTNDKTSAINQKDSNGGEDFTDSTVDWDTESPEARIRAELYEQRYFKKSALLASYIEDEFEQAGRKTWGVKQRDKGIQVLQATGMPSVLVETGYLSNKEEEEYLNSDNGQNEVVKNIIDALKKYKQQLEGTKPASAQAVDTTGNNK
jgi:N-acetylmuramoyl-L-alanine amidase